MSFPHDLHILLAEGKTFWILYIVTSLKSDENTIFSLRHGRTLLGYSISYTPAQLEAQVMLQRLISG